MQLSVYMTLEEQRRLREAARKLGVSNSYVVRLALRDILALPLGENGQTEVELVKAHMCVFGQTRRRVG